MEEARESINESKNNKLLLEAIGNWPTDYRYRFARSPKELIEKARIFSSGLDDRVVEMIRFQQQGVYYAANDENRDNKITTTMFVVDDSQPKFLFFTEKKTRYLVPIEMEHYNKIVEAMKDALDAEEGDYLIVDEAWVYSFFGRQ
jgi:hypothetical protein